jgi:WD40 repeat protein
VLAVIINFPAHRFTHGLIWEYSSRISIKMTSKVRAVVTKKNLEFTPGSLPNSTDVIANGENEFDVIVVNHSDKFASFQLELSTPVLDENSQVKWYKVEPEICAKKPPGSETKFHVIITQSPIAAYDTKIDLKLKAFSVEDISLSASQHLSLNIKKPLRPLRLEVPITKLKLIPESSVEIPVLVYNLSPEFCEIILTAGISDSKGSWLIDGNERKLLIESGKYEKANFKVLAPRDTSISKDYKLTIKVESNRSLYTARKNVTLNLIPSGNIAFYCGIKQKVIPNRRPVARNIVAYELGISNNSNLVQQINLNVPENTYKNCEFKVPETVELTPGESRTDVQLLAKGKRPWWGGKRQIFFETSANVTHSQEPNGESTVDITDIAVVPNTHVLELQILPIIPLWLQIFAGLIPFAFLAYWLMQAPTKIMHTASVNSVRFFGNGSLVFSGSSDRTIRKWQIEDGAWHLNTPYLEHKNAIADEKDIAKAVRVIRPNPNDSKDEIAIGLENGEVKLWDIATNKEKSLQETNAKSQKDNRVFDLAYTQNARFLFSGHGDGTVKTWSMETLKQTSVGVKVPFTISALALDDSQAGYPLLIIAGRYNQIVVWDMNAKTIYKLPYTYKQDQTSSNNSFSPVIGQHHYITSLATGNNVLASADNQGYITLWDMEKIRSCIAKPSPIKAETNKNSNSVSNTKDTKNGKKTELKTPDKLGNTTKILPCNLKYTQWRDGHDRQPVRSVSLTQDGKYLASGGDDGRAILWELGRDTEDERSLKIITEKPKPQKYQIDSLGIKINSIDIKTLPDKLLITTGDDEKHVRICRFNLENKNATCH